MNENYPGNVLKKQMYMSKKHEKSSLHIIALTGRSVMEKFYYSSSFFKYCDLFIAVLVYMQEQQNCLHKTWHISNGSSKISFVSLLRKKLFLPLFMFLYHEFLPRWEKLLWKMKNGLNFPGFPARVWRKGEQSTTRVREQAIKGETFLEREGDKNHNLG